MKKLIFLALMNCIWIGWLFASPSPKVQLSLTSAEETHLSISTKSNATTIVAIGFSFGNVRNNLKPGLAAELNANFGSAYKGYHAPTNRHIVVLSADDESPLRVKSWVQKTYPNVALSEISQNEFIKMAPSIK